MASRPKRRNSDNPTSRSVSPVPEYIVDLTVDSPVVTGGPPCRRRNVFRLDHNADIIAQAVESLHGAVIDIVDVDEADRTVWLLPPRKGSHKAKPAELEKIDVNVVPQLNDTVTGESEPLSCPVCLEFLGSKLKPTSTRCGHIYCAACIEKTLNTSKKCPKCNSKITQKSCIRLYF